MGFKLTSLFLKSLLDMDRDYSLTNLAVVTLDQEKLFPFNFLPTECMSIKCYTNYSQAKNHRNHMILQIMNNRSVVLLKIDTDF